MATVVPARRISTVHLLLLLLCLCCFNIVITSAQQLHPDELSVLRQIDAKLKVGWDFDTDPCSGRWTNVVDKSTMRNVTCGDCDANNTCRVTAILLKSQNLTGFLPSDFANLTSLVQLDLTRNYINGTIPPEWGSLPRLAKLDLGQNRISGSIPPELGSISTITSVTMENNLLRGPIPSTIGKLENLTRLIISGNDFTGELPESMGNLKKLEDLYVCCSHVSLIIFLKYFLEETLFTLTVILVYSYTLERESQLCLDFNINVCSRIDGTGISGKIPDFIGNWTNLQNLYMQGTSLEGSFPSLLSLQNLSILRVSDLKGVGTFPSLGNTQMTHLVLRNCSLSGRLPDTVGEMPKLKVLDLSFNNFTGEIPSSYPNLLKLSIVYMFLNNNSLTGSLPNWNPGASRYIDVSYNFFSESLGAPPDCFDGNENTIASFSSAENSTIKTCLRKNYPCEGNPTNYNLFINCGGSEVKVGDNQYEADSGNTVGPHSFRSPSGKWVFSSTGDFFDNDQMAYVASTNTILNTSNPELYRNARLSPSSLMYYGLCMQTGNYTVNLHFAEIMFIDGQTYFGVGRRFFDVYIQGQIVLKDFNIAEAANGTGRSVVKSFNATVGDGALEIQFRWAGKGTSSVPQKGVYGPLVSAISVTPNFRPDIYREGASGRAISTGAIIGIVVASCLVILLIVLIVCFLIQRRHQRYEGLKGVHLMTSKFTLRQIKSATGNFDRANKIGEGGFGPVFKGVLPDGTLIAVKKLSARSKQGNREFINEIGLISSLQHPNLVKLYGCCVEEDQLLLVYEYMENNSLATVLFGERKEEIKLDWRTRHNICLGVARGLAYLHEESRLKIVHRDIKTNNVLLDKDLNAKISDFGLAKLDDDENTHMSTRIAGTRGYMAPEYATRGHLTDKADVYSFGIVLLEILSGKSYMIHMPDSTKVHLLDLARDLEKNGRLHELVDENLGSDYSRDELVQIIKLALACANKSPSNRPAMSTVVSMLETGEFIQTQPLNKGLSNRQEPIDVYSILEVPHYSNDLSEDRSSKDPPTTTTGTYSQSSMQLNMDSYMEAIPR